MLSPPCSLCLTICFSRTPSSRTAYSTVPNVLLIIIWINQMSNWEGNSQDASVQQHISNVNIHQCFNKQRREILFIEMRQFKVSLKYFNNHLTSLYFYSKFVFIMAICEHIFVMKMWVWRQRNLKRGVLCNTAAHDNELWWGFISKRKKLNGLKNMACFDVQTAVNSHTSSMHIWQRQHESAQKCASCLKGTLWLEGNRQLS